MGEGDGEKGKGRRKMIQEGGMRGKQKVEMGKKERREEKEDRWEEGRRRQVRRRGRKEVRR